MFGTHDIRKAWLVLFHDNRHGGYADYRDAQNNAALGDWNAIWALEQLQIELIVRKLTS